MNKYYGNKKIVREIQMGDDVKLEFENEDSEVIRLKMKDYVITDEPIDLPMPLLLTKMPHTTPLLLYLEYSAV